MQTLATQTQVQVGSGVFSFDLILLFVSHHTARKVLHESIGFDMREWNEPATTTLLSEPEGDFALEEQVGNAHHAFLNGKKKKYFTSK